VERNERPRRGREDDRAPRPGRSTSSSLEIGDDDIDIPAFLR
jgi:cell division protein FtsZ